ncbi:hypothetical protein A3C37_01745 [Candidatus Peribacteria bacterium RIFCSPHIGHO2_02_FULL_53_20]|nr:MAG: hypothetical protein A3C37_01745 [Candidatus Peribacteria bacterium RIFCSPHIGHO2_02_FULL_53_20]
MRRMTSLRSSSRSELREGFTRLHPVGLRRGFTLIEVIIFVAIFSMIITVMLPLLFSVTETRLRQQTIALVEDNSAQIVQNLMRRARNTERILQPAIGSTGAVLALQHGSGGLHPMIFGVQTGSLIVIERDIKSVITSEQVAVIDFVIRNTSVSEDKQSFTYSFRVSRTIRLERPHTYDRRFEGAITLHPDDTPLSGGCSCSAPSCNAGIYSWNVCSASSCSARTEPIICP